ncbi:MAG: hypothetical protein JWO77_393 [Ilumatobacteraceae bacterium]|nr:hypothetical protein [Ilumatobacteraceae bacterium]
MRTRTTLAAVGIALGLVLASTACGSSDASSKPTTTTSAKGNGGDVDIDGDGTVKYTDEDGNETELDLDGSGASLPEDWPGDLAPPASVKLVTSTTATVDGDTTMTVLGEAQGTVADLVPSIKDQVEAGGFEITQDATGDASGSGYAGMTATKGGDELVVAIATDPSTKGKVTLTMTLTSKG